MSANVIDKHLCNVVNVDIDNLLYLFQPIEKATAQTMC